MTFLVCLCIPSVKAGSRDVNDIKFIKSLLPSLFQREDLFPSLAKRGWGDLLNSIVHLSLKAYSSEIQKNYTRTLEPSNP
jgi:hypothetical protein